MKRFPISGVCCVVLACQVSAVAADRTLSITWKDNMLTIKGDHLPGKTMDVWYLEAYCRPGSTDRVWNETVIGHKTELVSASDDQKVIKLKCTLSDGVTVFHTIAAGKDVIDFQVTAKNPTGKTSQAHWAQPCIRVDNFTGTSAKVDKYAYVPKSFIFVNGKLARMPTQPWATEARYTPGQVYCPKQVPRGDVNPRPLSSIVPSNGLIGCFSKDEKMIFATAFEPYQELFQGVIVCLHSDFRIGGLKPGETKKIRGKIYLMDNDVKALVKRYRKDFSEHVGSAKKK